VLRRAGIFVALLLTGTGASGAVDAVAAYGEFYVQSALMAKCRPQQDAGASAFLAQGDGLRRAALEEFSSELDAVNPTHRRENRLRAEEMLRQERVKRDAEIAARIQNYGCDAKDPSDRGKAPDASNSS
jgi:hypothetical protein